MFTCLTHTHHHHPNLTMPGPFLLATTTVPTSTHTVIWTLHLRSAPEHTIFHVTEQCSTNTRNNNDLHSLHSQTHKTGPPQCTHTQDHTHRGKRASDIQGRILPSPACEMLMVETAKLDITSSHAPFTALLGTRHWH